jgi:hypothetical protein
MKTSIRNLLPQFLSLVLMLMLPGISYADAPMPSLESLARDADLIVVAKVESITTEPFQFPLDPSSNVVKGDKQVANAEVLEVWKGSLSEKVRFLASPTWECDVSKAFVGETVLLFLRDNSKNPYMTIAYNGIGRLPVEESSVLLYNALLTKEIKNLLSLPADTFRYSVEVNTLKQQIEHIMKEKK